MPTRQRHGTMCAVALTLRNAALEQPALEVRGGRRLPHGIHEQRALNLEPDRIRRRSPRATASPSLARVRRDQVERNRDARYSSRDPHPAGRQRRAAAARRPVCRSARSQPIPMLRPHDHATSDGCKTSNTYIQTLSWKMWLRAESPSCTSRTFSASRGDSLLLLSALRSIEHDPDRQVIAEALEAMPHARRHKDQFARRKVATRAAADELT